MKDRDNRPAKIDNEEGPLAGKDEKTGIITDLLEEDICRNEDDRVLLRAAEDHFHDPGPDLNREEGSVRPGPLHTEKPEKVFTDLFDEPGKRYENVETVPKGIVNRDEDLEKEEKASRQADREYTVVIRGERFSVPPVCTCCLKPTSDREEILCAAVEMNTNGSTKTRPIRVEMPICKECRDHRKQFSGKSKRICGFCILIGVLITSLAYMAFKTEKSVALCMGGAVTVALYFVMNSTITMPPLSEAHSSRLKSVRMYVPMRDNRSSPASDAAPVSFTFTNWKYALLFQMANSPHASKMKRTERPNSAKQASVFKLKPGHIWSVLGILCIFLLCSLIIFGVD